MSGRADCLAIALSFILALPLPASAGSGRNDSDEGDSPFDPVTEKAVLYYQDHLFNVPSGIYEHDGWTYFQARVPIEDSSSGRTKAQRDAFSVLDRLVLRWMIDRSVEKRGKDEQPNLSPGATLIRNLVWEVSPEYEFGKVEIPPVDLVQVAEQTDDGVFVAASVGKTSELLRCVPENIGAPWPSSRWVASTKDAVRLRYKASPALFLVEAGALDPLSVRLNEAPEGFPDVASGSFSEDIAGFIRRIVGSVDSRNEKAMVEMKSFADELSRYVSESEEGRYMRDRALSLQRTDPIVRTVFSPPSVSVETNRVATVVTNWIEQAETSSNRTVRTLAGEATLRGSVPYGGKVFLERTSVPIFTVTTNETITIRRRTDARAEEVRVEETGRPQFERLFLSAGTLPNASAPQTDRGGAAVALFYKKGVATSDKETALKNALGENPGDKNLWNFLGRIYQDRKDWLGAAICFRNALRLDPEFDYALTNLADCHKALGNMNLAVGTAVLARGLATNEWCEKRAAAILEAPVEAFGKP